MSYADHYRGPGAVLQWAQNTQTNEDNTLQAGSLLQVIKVV